MATTGPAATPTNIPSRNRGSQQQQQQQHTSASQQSQPQQSTQVALASAAATAASPLPPNAARASRNALQTAMTEVANGVTPGSSLSSRPNGASSASGTSATPSAAADQGKEEGELSRDDSGVAVGDGAGEERAKDGANEMKTVFEDPDNFNLKHPLASQWTLWFDNPSQKGMANARGSKDTWGDDLNKVVDLDSVEEFWGLYHNIIPPSQLPAKANYYLFKQGIKPAWEDPANANGGKWAVQFPREKSRGTIDSLWLYTMLSAIGETLDTPYPSGTPRPLSDDTDELITGVIMAARPNFYRLAVWTRRADQDVEAINERLMDIGKNFKVNVLGFKLDEKVGSSYGTEIEFQSHTESEKKKGRKTII